MTINYTGGELKFSGVVTNSELYSRASSNQGVTKTSDSEFKLTSNIRILDGCDTSQIRNIIISLNTREVISEATTAPIFNQITFIESGKRSVGDRFIFKVTSGGVYPEFNNCQLIHNMSGTGSGGDPRLLTEFYASSLSNTVIRSSDFSEQETSLNLPDSGLYENVACIKTTNIRAIGNSTRVHIQNLFQSSAGSSGGGKLNPNSGASMMMTNWDREILDPSSTNHIYYYPYGAGSTPHWLYLLGTAGAVYQPNGSGIHSINNNTHVAVGGNKHLKFIGGADARFSYYDSRSSVAAKSFPTFDNQEMLETVTVKNLGGDEYINYIPLSLTYNRDTGSFVETAITNQFYRVRKYGKAFIENSVTDVNSVSGSVTLPEPVVMVDDEYITEMDASVVAAYPHIANADQLYDYVSFLCVGLLDIPHVIQATEDTLNILEGWSLERDQTISANVSINLTTNTIKVRTATAGMVGTEKFSKINGTVVAFNGFTDMDFIIVPNQTNFRLTNLVAGSSVAILNSGLEVGSAIQVVGTTAEIIMPFIGNFDATVRIIADGYVMSNIVVPVTEGIVNFITPTQTHSFGQTSTTARIKGVDGTDLGLTNGRVNLDLTTKTFSMVAGSELSTRDVFTAIMKSWDESTLNHVNLPVSVDDIRGLSLSLGYGLINSHLLGDEGYVHRTTSDTVTKLRYCIKVSNNPVPVQYQVYYDGVGQGIVTLATTGTEVTYNQLIDIDHTVSDVKIKISAKHPQFIFKVVEEDIIVSGVIVADRFRLKDTAYGVAPDPAVFIDESGNSDFSLSKVSTVAADVNGIARTFSNGEISLRTGTNTLTSVINQLAAISAADFDLDEKLYTLTGTTGINVAQGYYLTINGAVLSGSLRGMVNLFHDTGEFAKPDYKSLNLNLASSWTGVPIEYIVVADDATLLTTNPTVLTDADGNLMRGQLTPSDLSNVLTLTSSLDVPVVVLWGAVGVEIQQARLVLNDAGVDLTISPVDEVIKLYSDETITVDNLETGEKAYNPALDLIVIDLPTRSTIIQNTMSGVEVSFIYRKWRKSVEADFNNLKFGILAVGLNQGKPTGATNNAHLFSPNWFMSWNYVIDVYSSRDTATYGLIEIQASALGRYEIEHGFAEFNNGIVYESPLSNGSAPVISLVVGFSTQALSNMTNLLVEIRNAAITNGIELKSTDRTTLEAIATLTQSETIRDEIFTKVDDQTVSINGSLTGVSNSISGLSSNITNLSNEGKEFETGFTTATAIISKEFNTVFTVIDSTDTTIDVELEKVVGDTFVAVAGSPISLAKIVDGEYKLSHTFDETGVYVARFNDTVSVVNVIDNSIDKILVRMSNLPQS